MATTLFKNTTYSAFGLIEDIKQGALRSASGALIWTLMVPWPDFHDPVPLAVDQGIAYVADFDETIRALRSQGA